MFKNTLSEIKHLKYLNIKATLAFITLVSLTALCCGKRTPPLPPTEQVTQRTTIKGLQIGNQIILSWKMPARNSTVNDITNINRIDVYRLAEPLSSGIEITEDEFSQRSTLIDTISIGIDDFSLKTFIYKDNLEFSDQTARLRYSIRFVNKAGQKASFSNFLTIEPSAKVADKPEKLIFEVTQEAIILSWTKPQTNVDGSTPANILGYNIYRSDIGQSNQKKLNSAPTNETTFSDKFFDFGNTYSYIVRTLSIGSEGESVESSDSVELKIQPKDTFAPSSPESLTIASAPNSISIFFTANLEKDIAGYKIYRSTDKNLPLNEWELLTPEVQKTNTFQDQKIVAGVRYYYYLTAVDKFGNTSQPSEIINEIAP